MWRIFKRYSLINEICSTSEGAGTTCGRLSGLVPQLQRILRSLNWEIICIRCVIERDLLYRLFLFKLMSIVPFNLIDLIYNSGRRGLM